MIHNQIRLATGHRLWTGVFHLSWWKIKKNETPHGDATSDCWDFEEFLEKIKLCLDFLFFQFVFISHSSVVGCWSLFSQKVDDFRPWTLPAVPPWREHLGSVLVGGTNVFFFLVGVWWCFEPSQDHARNIKEWWQYIFIYLDLHIHIHIQYLSTHTVYIHIQHIYTVYL